MIALNHLSNLLSKKCKFVEAERYARHANRVVKDNSQLLDTLGWVLYLKRQYPQAAEVLSEAAALAPNIAVIIYHLGMAQFETGDSVNAKSGLNKALSLDANADWADSARAKLAQ